MTLLIVEDIPEEAEKLRAAALDSGLVDRVRWAPDLSSARMILDATAGMHPEERDGIIVFLDHDLPESYGGPDTGSGADIAKAMLRIDPDTPIVGISAVPSNNVHLESCGAFMSVEKAYASQLMPSILRACVTWRKAMEKGRNPNLPIY